MSPSSTLNELASRHPLPEPWSRTEAVLDRFVADGLELHRAGLSATARGEEVNGAAVAVDASPVARAYFELLERASTLEAMRDARDELELLTAGRARVGNKRRADLFPESDEPARWRHARSNGVAVHVDWPTACQRALEELAERDRVLRAWFGEIRPRPLPLPTGAPLVERTRSYAWRAVAFPPEGGASWSRGLEVVGVFGFPLEPNAPFVFGYGARPKLTDALASALDEATQILGFLWGETIPERAPAPSPGPLFHLEYFQVRDHHTWIRAWLEGAHVAFAREASALAPRGDAGTTRDGAVRFVDLTPRGVDGSLCVAKAVCPDALPLIFGEGPLGAHLPEHLRVHPIA